MIFSYETMVRPYNSRRSSEASNPFVGIWQLTMSETWVDSYISGDTRQTRSSGCQGAYDSSFSFDDFWDGAR